MKTEGTLLPDFQPRPGAPVYRQLAEELSAQIHCGRLEHGRRLPAVRELSGQLGLAPGTVQRAYDELAREGLVKKSAGSGSFVCYAPPDEGRAQTLAAEAADALLSRLSELGLTPGQMKRLLLERLHRYCAQPEPVRVALVECNPEVLAQIAPQLCRLPDVLLTTFLLDEVRAQPGALAAHEDMMITTTEHASELGKMTGQPEKIAKIALRLSSRSVSPIVRLAPGQHVGMAVRSLRFGRLLGQFLSSYTEGLLLDEPCLLDNPETLRAYLTGKTALLVPEGWESFCPAQSAALLRAFSHTQKLIPCAYSIDEGSAIYVREKLERLQLRRSLK